MAGSNGSTVEPHVVEVVPDRRYLAFLSDPPDSDALRELRMLGFQLRDESTRGWAEVAAEVGNWIITGVATATVAETYQALARRFRRNRELRVAIHGTADLRPILADVLGQSPPNTDLDIISSERTEAGNWEVRFEARGIEYRALVNPSAAVVEWKRI